MNTDILKQNCFEVFGLAPEFEIQTSNLNAKLHELQKQFHPDNSLNNDLATDLISSHINSCYSTLKSPLNRSIALLETLGFSLDLSKDTSLPIEFLGEQMELHEQIDDANDNISVLEDLEHTIMLKQKNLLDTLKSKFANKDYQEALNLTKQLGFYTRLLNSIADKIGG